MRKLIVTGVLMAGFFATSVYAADGAKIFKKKGCSSCHHATKDQVKMGLGPSLKMVSEKYKGKEAELVTFFKGKGEPRVVPAKFPIMKAQLVRFKGLSDDDLNALASFITSH